MRTSMENTWNSQQTPDPDLANQRTKKIVRLVIVLFVLIDLPVGWMLYQFHFRGNTDVSQHTVTFTIITGESADRVARRLDQEGIVGNAFLFRLAAKLSGRDTTIHPGTFMLPARTSIFFALDTLTDAQSQERTITLLEGWTLKDMGEYLVQQGAVTSTDAWYAVVGTPPSAGRIKSTEYFRDEFSFLNTPWKSELPSGATLEGYLFPDTYRIAADATPEDIVRTMLRNFEKRVTPIEIPRQGRVVHDVITLASILEREVRSDEDRRKVADIFLRRTQMGMALQADSTVNYITGKKAASITLDDRDIDSPWNTYKYPGLPPTPISNPSLSAIRAVLNPEPNEYLYFLTDDAGTVHYAKTHDEHVANKNRYLK